MTRRLPTPEEIRAALRPLDFFERYAHGGREGQVYVDTHARRFHHALIELADLPAGSRTLELGAVPYYMTVLLRRELGFEVTPVSFYEVDRAAAEVHEVADANTGEVFAFPYRPLNVERDPFPYEDHSFDVVVCCEILEHLLINPSHMLYEAHRVLRPGGVLLVSTPNVTRWENVLKLAAGQNIYDHYHGNGIYGRHNREYTRAEVQQLVVACGFEVDRAGTRDVYESPFRADHTPAGEDRHDTIFVRGRATGRPRLSCPGNLYVLMDEYRNVLYASLAMGVNDVGHLGAGWHEPEWDEARGSRWTGESATCVLKVPPGAKRVILECCAHHPDLATRPVLLSVSAGSRALGTIALSSYGWQTGSLPLADPPDSPSLSLTLSVDRCWSPAAAGLHDPRELGVRVSRIGIE